MKKRNLFFIIILPLLLLGSVFAFRTSLKLTFVDWTLREYCKKNLGYQLSYEKMTLLQDDIILIEGLSLVREDSAPYFAGVLRCPGAYLKVDWDIWSKSFYSQIHMQNFEICAGKWPAGGGWSSGFSFENRGFLMTPHISLSGEGAVRWDGRLSGCLFDLELADDIAGMVQVEDLAIDITGFGESGEIVFKGQGLDANKIAGLGKKLFPDSFPGNIKKGDLSGALVLRGGTLFGALSSENLQVELDSLYLTFPKVDMAIDRGKGHLVFDSALAENAEHRVTDIDGIVEFNCSEWSLRSEGKLRGMKLAADVSSTGFDFHEGSVITLDSDDSQGVISLSGVNGKVEYSGSCSLFGLPFDIERMSIEADLINKGSGFVWRGQAGYVNAQSTEQKIGFEMLTARDLSLTTGFFSGKNIFVERIHPFGAWTKGVSVEGVADIEGNFEGTVLKIHGNSSDLAFKGDDWNFLAASDSSIEIVMDHEKESFDVSGTIGGGKFIYLPCGLILEEIAASFGGTDKQVSFEDVRAECLGVKVGGDVIMSFKPSIDIEVYQHTLKGNISDIKEILSRFGMHASLFSLPLSGDLVYRDEGAFFKWTGPKGTLSGTIGASLQKGICDFSDYDLLFHDLELDFVYDIASDFLDVRGGSGSFCFGQSDDLSFVVDKFVSSELSRGVVDFDFWCGDKKRDKIRVSGKSEMENEDLVIRFDREATHFGTLYPDNLLMTLNESGLKTWNLDMCFSWEDAKGELQQLLGARIVPFHQNLQLLLTNSEIVHGDFGVSISYDNDRSLLDYRILGKDLNFGGWRFNQFQFLGSCCSDEWKIQKCELDDLSIAADLTLDNGCYLVSFLGCRLGNVSLFGMDGKFYPELNQIEANLNLVEINLAELNKISFLKAFVNKYRLQGEARATSGRLNAKMGDKDWDIDLFFSASLKDFSLQGVPFRDFETISVDYQTNKKLTIKSASASTEGESGSVCFELDNADFDLCYNEIAIKGLHFFIPSPRLNWAANLMRGLFPGAVNSSLANFVERIKGSYSLEGILDFDLNPVSSLLSVRFKDGDYEFFDHIYCLRDFHFIKKDQEIEIGAECLALNQWFDLKTCFLGKAFPHGILKLSSRRDADAPPLEVWWKTGERLKVEKIEGCIAGYDIKLEPFEDKLKGSVEKEGFSADLEVCSRRILCRNAFGPFMGGTIDCPYAAAYTVDRRWEITVPEITARGLKVGRLNGWEDFLDETMTVDRLEISDLCGPLEDFQRLSCSGRVSFSCEARQKKMFPFVKEKIKNISALRPFAGEIDFCLDSGNVTVSGLHEMVDGRHLFRYTLPSFHKNTLGVDGAISMVFNLMPHSSKVRVGDLISVVIEGTVDRPVFFIRKTDDMANLCETQ